MSFGASPSDIIIVVTFCKALYRKCRDAGGEYDEISREVRGLHTVLRHLKYEVEAPESPLNRDRSIWGRQLAPIIGDCDFTLRQLDGLLQKYGRLSSASLSPSSPRILWDKVRFGSNEMDTLGTIRVKLISHKTSLTLFLDTIQLHQSGKMSQTLDNHGGQLDVILDKVDGIAARMAPPRSGGSVLTSYEDDDREVWKQFRRELVAEGFSSDVLQQHKDVLRAYIREIDQKGLLDDVSPNSHTPPQAGVNPERWLDAVRTGSSEDPPPSFSSLGAATDDSGAKEMVIREDNMKFPTGMKMERPKPETRRDGMTRDVSGQLEVVTSRDRRRASGNSQRRPSPVPRLITSSDEKDEKDVLYFNTSGSDSDTESETSSKGSRRPQMGLVIRTSDLLASSQALTLRPISPSSYRSSQGSFGEDDAVRSMAQRQRKQLEYGTSPSRTGVIPIPVPPSSNPRSSIDGLATSPRPTPIKLAPDEHGNEIPPDAKWTRINRRLVSPEVLSHDGRRYEARPDFVAVLGVLSRAEIEALASRSHALRAARHQRSQSTPHPPCPTTLPIPMPVPMPNPSSSPRGVAFASYRSGRDTPSSSGSESDDSSDDHVRDHGVDGGRRKRRPKAPRSYASSNAGVPVSGYPNPYGSPLPPSPLFSGPSSHPERGGGGKDKDLERERDGHRGDHERRERERGERERRRHSSKSSHARPRERDRPAPAPKSSSRWKEHMTAAGIGGAAASLLNVLTEAAEGL